MMVETPIFAMILSTPVDSARVRFFTAVSASTLR